MKFYIAKFAFKAAPTHEVYAIELPGGAPEDDATAKSYAIGTDPSMRIILSADNIANATPNNEIEQLALRAITSNQLQLLEKHGDDIAQPTNDRIALTLFCITHTADSPHIFITNQYTPLPISNHALLLSPSSIGSYADGNTVIHYHIVSPVATRLPTTKRQLAYNLLRSLRVLHVAHIIHGHVATSVYNGLLDAASAELDLERAMSRHADVIGMITVLFDTAVPHVAMVADTHYKRVFIVATYYDIAAALSITMPEYWTNECLSDAITHSNRVLNGDLALLPIDAILNKFEKTYCR